MIAPPLSRPIGPTGIVNDASADVRNGHSSEDPINQVDRKHATKVAEDLLLLARLDSGRPLAQEPVDLTRLLLEAVEDARVVAPGHRWRLDLPEDAVPVEVIGDEARLHQVVSNLGLALVRAIVAAHGGTVLLATDPGLTAIRVAALSYAKTR